MEPKTTRNLRASWMEQTIDADSNGGDRHISTDTGGIVETPLVVAQLAPELPNESDLRHQIQDEYDQRLRDELDRRRNQQEQQRQRSPAVAIIAEPISTQSPQEQDDEGYCRFQRKTAMLVASLFLILVVGLVVVMVVLLVDPNDTKQGDNGTNSPTTSSSSSNTNDTIYTSSNMFEIPVAFNMAGSIGSTCDFLNFRRLKTSITLFFLTFRKKGIC